MLVHNIMKALSLKKDGVTAEGVVLLKNNSLSVNVWLRSHFLSLKEDHNNEWRIKQRILQSL